jgi:integrase
MTATTQTRRNTESRLPRDKRRPKNAGATASNAATLYLARQAESSRQTQYAALKRMARILASSVDPVDPETFQWARLTYSEVVSLRQRLLNELAPATVNRYLVALRGVLGEAWADGQLDADARARLCWGLRSVRAMALARGRVVPAGELAGIFAACKRDASPSGARDAAALALMIGCGARRDEVSRLDVGDVDLVGGEARLHGKGRRDRLVPITASVATMVREWEAILRKRGGPLFRPVRRGRIGHGRLGPSGLWRLVHKRAREAGIRLPTSPHDLRRSAATTMLAGGADLNTVRKVLGHANIATTVMYDRRGSEVERRAVELIELTPPEVTT